MIMGLSLDLLAMDSSDENNPVFSYDYQSLNKPKNMGGMTWLRALEDERNKADCLGNLEAFKNFSLEISATIGGKYGLSSRQATPEEQAELIYSITRTRHKFSGAKDILPRFYGVGDVNKLSSDHQAHLAAVLTIDTLAAEAMGNDGMLNQWAEVKADQPVNAKFINDVKAHAKAWTKEPLVTTLEPVIDSFLQNSKTIALAHDVFSIFAPKVTFETIYTEMFNGEYRGWTVHGCGAFARSISMDENEKEVFPDLEMFARKKFEFKENIFCRSAVAELSSAEITKKLSLKPQTLVLEYPYNECFDELTGGFAGRKVTRSLWLTREVKHSLMKTLKHPYAKVSEKSLLDIYQHRASLIYNLREANILKDFDLEFLIAHGDVFTATLLEDIIFSGGRGMQKNTPKAVEVLLREIADLDDEFAKTHLSNFLNNYGILMFNGQNGVEIDRGKAVELLREAADLGNENAKTNLPLFLNDYGISMFNGQNGVKRDMPKAIELVRESRDLGCYIAKNNLAIFINNYGWWMFNGQNGVERNMPKAIEFLRESAALGCGAAKINLTNCINKYGDLTLCLSTDRKKDTVEFRGGSAFFKD